MGHVSEVPVARSSRRSATEIRPARHHPDLGKTRASRSSRRRNASRGATSPTRSISEKSTTFRLSLRLNRVHSTGARLLPSRSREKTSSLARGSAGASPSRTGSPQPQDLAWRGHYVSDAHTPCRCLSGACGLAITSRTGPGVSLQTRRSPPGHPAVRGSGCTRRCRPGTPAWGRFLRRRESDVWSLAEPR